jgi:hypothetical protein
MDNTYRCWSQGERFMVKSMPGTPEEIVLCPFHKRMRRLRGQKVWLKSGE